MEKSLKIKFKAHIALFGYNFFIGNSKKLWIWLLLQLIFVTTLFFSVNYSSEYNIYFRTRITWLVIGTVVFVNYLIFLVLNLINIFKNDTNNGMNIIFFSKSFNRLTLYLNKIISLFIISLCYCFIFFIYSLILSAFVASPYKLMIININGYLLLTEITIFFVIVGLTLCLRMSQKGLTIFFCLMLFLVFPIMAIVVPGMIGPTIGGLGNVQGISDYNILAGEDLNVIRQYNYLLNKYGKEKITNSLTNDWETIFKANFRDNEEEITNKNRDIFNEINQWEIKSVNFTETTWKEDSIRSLFTIWDNNKVNIIEANSLKEVYNNTVEQTNKLKKTNLYGLYATEKFNFYLELLKFALENEQPIIETIKSGKHKVEDPSSYYDASFYTPLIFEKIANNKMAWKVTDDSATIAFNCFLIYSFKFYKNIINPFFLKPANRYKDYDINSEIKKRFIILNYLNIFRQMLIMWQRPSLTKWKYEMNLKPITSYLLYGFFNHHDFIPYYDKNNDKKRNYINLEKSGYQFNMPVMYVSYLLVGIGLIALSWLTYRKKDLV